MNASPLCNSGWIKALEKDVFSLLLASSAEWLLPSQKKNCHLILMRLMWRWSVCDNAGERYCPCAGYIDVELDTHRPRVILLTRHKQFACLPDSTVCRNTIPFVSWNEILTIREPRRRLTQALISKFTFQSLVYSKWLCWDVNTKERTSIEMK